MNRFVPLVLIAVAISVVLSRVALAGRLTGARAALDERREALLADFTSCEVADVVPAGGA